MSFLSRVFRLKDQRGKKHGAVLQPNSGVPVIPHWEESWSRTEVQPEEILELIHTCTQEVKSRALETPYFLLPFRPKVDTSAAKSTVRNYFRTIQEQDGKYTGDGLSHQLRLTDLPALCSILKWCWSRLPGGVITWDAYELFKIGESDSNFARHAFNTFIPLSVRSQARKQIIFDFFELLAAVAARSKTNGFTGRKLPRMAAWWAFELSDTGKGFDGGYKSWAAAADACTHLFFAYLRSMAPDDDSTRVISILPLSLQSLLAQTEYPPETPTLLQTSTTKVVMIVNKVSPTPYSLLRRAKHFEYRDDDPGLQEFSSYDDPVSALTEECCRVLQCISSTNESASHFGRVPEPSWSRFEDVGFGTMVEVPTEAGDLVISPRINHIPRSANNDNGRPTTPSWADFLSTGFEENKEATNTMLVPPSEQLPPIRGYSSQSHTRKAEDVEPGELASIGQFDLDETFWWVWITSLASEEPAGRKAVFGRCTILETRIRNCRWLVVEEQVKGATPDQEEGAYIAPKKSRFGFSLRSRNAKTKKLQLAVKPAEPVLFPSEIAKASIPADQHAIIQKAAASLREKSMAASNKAAVDASNKDKRESQNRTSSVFSLTGAEYALPAALSWAAGGLADVPEDSDAEGQENSKPLPAPPPLTSASSVTMPLPTRTPEITVAAPSTPHVGGPSPASIAMSPAPIFGKLTESLFIPGLNRSASTVQKSGKKGSPKQLRGLFSRKVVPESGSADATDTLSQPTVVPTDVAVAKTEISKAISAQSPLSLSPVHGALLPSAQTSSVQLSRDPSSVDNYDHVKGPLLSGVGSSPPRVGGAVLSSEFTSNAPSNNAPVLSKQTGPRKEPSSPPVRKVIPPSSPPVTLPTFTKDPPKLADTPLSSGSPQYPTPQSHPMPLVFPREANSLEVASTSQPRLTHPPRPSSPEDQVIPDFQRDMFTAGPLTDMPAFIPDSDDEGMLSTLTPRASTVAAPSRKLTKEFKVEQSYGPNSGIPSSLLQMPSIRVNSPESSGPTVRPNRAVAPSQRIPIKTNPSTALPGGNSVSSGVNDRWAQIRKNAQERAAKLSEEQRSKNRPSVAVGAGIPADSSTRSDDAGSDTSSEETIESRVARIKARVAELTGNIDASGNLTAAHVRTE